MKALIYILFIVLFASCVFSANIINYTYPTPGNNSVLTVNNFYVNVSINSSNLTYAFTDLDNSLLLWMRMDDTNQTIGTYGAKVYDLSRYGNNGTVYGNATQIVNGKFGKGMGFDGNNSYIQTGTISVAANQSYAFSVWFNAFNVSADSDGYYRRLIQGITNSRPTLAVGYGNLVFNVHNTSNGDIGISYNGVNLNQWYHAVAMYNASTSSISLYVNGVLRNSIIVPNGTRAFSNKINIGALSATSGRWNGSIDEVIFFNRSLSSQEILALYNASAYQYQNNFTSLNDGTHTFTSYAVDVAGNMNNTETRQVTINTGVPSIQFVNPTDYNNSYVNRNYILVNVTASDSIALINITINAYNSSLVNSTSSTTSPYYVNISGLSDGVYYINATAINSGGATSSTETRIITVDTTAASLTYITPSPNEQQVINSGTLNVSTIDAAANRTYSFFTDGLVGWWRMDKTYPGENDTYVYDWSGLGNNGTVINGAVWNNSNKMFGVGSYSFDGNGDYINLTTNQLMNFTGRINMTVSAWIYATSLNNFSGILSNDLGSYSNTSRFGLQYYNGALRLTIGNGTNYDAFSSAAGSITNMNQWYFISAVVNSTSVVFYIDGVKSGLTGTRTRDLAVSNISWVIGRVYNGNFWWNGSIDEMMVFNRSLSSDEVKALYNSSQYYLTRTIDNSTQGMINYTAKSVDVAGNVNSASRSVIVDTNLCHYYPIFGNWNINLSCVYNTSFMNVYGNLSVFSGGTINCTNPTGCTVNMTSQDYWVWTENSINFINRIVGKWMFQW